MSLPDTPLEQALRIYLRWSESPEPEPVDAVLERHPELREVLEPMFENDDHTVDTSARTHPEAPAPVVDGRRIGGYRLIREIGRGGMGVVFEGEHETTRERFAIKVLPPHLTLHPTAIARFRREADVAKQLTHPGLVRVHAFGEEDDTHFFVMDLVAGAPLNQVLADLRTLGCEELDRQAFGRAVAHHRLGRTDGNHDETEFATAVGDATYAAIVIQVVVQIADALQHAHARGVIHRDVKPSNILVRADGTAVLTDFGLARQEGLPSITVTGDFAGTPYYVSPEQAMSKRMAVDHRTDVFSLGATLYELLTLRKPFDGETSQQVLGRIVTKDPIDPDRINLAVPPDLVAIVQKALEKDPDRRYASAAELATDLRAFLAYQPVAARARTRYHRLARWVRRNPVVSALSGALIVAVLGTAVWTLVKNAQLASALDDVLRLSDEQIAGDLLAAHNHLPASDPDDAPELDAWLDQAREILARRPAHERRLARLRSTALDYGEADRQRDRETHPRFGEYELWRTRLAESERGLEAAADADARRLRARVRAARAKLEELTAVVETRRTWRFADPTDQWQHDRLTELRGRLDRLIDPVRGTYVKVTEWREHMRTVRQRSIDDHREAWADAIAAVRAAHGIDLEPQLGLVPLGRDPDSLLQEFAHLQTGAIPQRDGDGRIVVTDDTGLVFVLLPGGSFRMGARRPDADHPVGSPQVDPYALDHEWPIDEIELDPFFISKYEMTQGQWRRFLGRTPSQFPAGRPSRAGTATDHNPVETVSQVTCTEVVTAMGLTLPTEAQWEYAARGGTTTIFPTGDDPNSVAGAANLLGRSTMAVTGMPIDEESTSWDDGYGFHAPAGSFAPNPFGLHDTVGNVEEWCRDEYHPYSTPARAGDGLRGRILGRLAVTRGGSFAVGLRFARSASRQRLSPESRQTEVGVRPARAVDQR